jgi:hypothetical protein
MAASGRGRDQPPEGWGLTDDSTQRRHYVLQALLLVGLIVLARFAPEPWRFLAVPLFALVLPGAVISLLLSQRLLVALNPLAWLRLGDILGGGYAVLVLASAGVLALQAYAPLLLESARPQWLWMLVFYFVAHHLTFSLFRLFGLAVREHTDALGFERDEDDVPVLERDKEHAHRSSIAIAALNEPEPGPRADKLLPLLQRGADEGLHAAYREALKQAGRHEALQQHAQVRSSELIAMGQLRAALGLVNEALKADPGFTLPESESIHAVLQQAEKMNLHRLAATLAGNYFRSFPRRRDALPLAAAAARLLAGPLQDEAAAAMLLRAALAQADEGERPPLQAQLEAIAARLPRQP